MYSYLSKDNKTKGTSTRASSTATTTRASSTAIAALTTTTTLGMLYRESRRLGKPIDK
jgi:hypothetical protein